MSQQRFDIPLRLKLALSKAEQRSDAQLQKDLVRLSELVSDIQIERIPGLERSILVGDIFSDDNGKVELEGAVQLFFDTVADAMKGASQFDHSLMLRDDMMSALRLTYPGEIKSGSLKIGSPQQISVDSYREPSELAALADQEYSFGERGLELRDVSGSHQSLSKDHDGFSWAAALPWLLFAALLGTAWLGWLNMSALNQLRAEIREFHTEYTRIEGREALEARRASRNGAPETGGAEQAAQSDYISPFASRDAASPVPVPDTEPSVIEEVQPSVERTSVTPEPQRVIIEVRTQTAPAPAADLPRASGPDGSYTPDAGGFVSLSDMLDGGEAAQRDIPRIYRGG